MSELISITIDTGNAAFDDAPASEIARILRKVADEFESYGAAVAQVRDRHGNPCGNVLVREVEDA